VIGILVEWLDHVPTPAEKAVEDDGIELTSKRKDEELKEGSISLGPWSYHNASKWQLPSMLSALASILLNRKEAGRDRYLAILDSHLSREHNPSVWKALLMKLGSAGGFTPQVVSTFFASCFFASPKSSLQEKQSCLLPTPSAGTSSLCFELISDWRKSDRTFLQRAYGELCWFGRHNKAKGRLGTCEGRDHCFRHRGD